MISVHQLEATIGGKQLFRDLSFILNSGNRLAVIGQNGCGKTTLLRMLAGEESPSHGSLDVSQERVVFAKQHIEADDTLTINDYLDVGEYPDTWRLLSEVGLIDTPLESAIGSLSGGQKTKLVLVNAFAKPSTTLLLDEPTNHLDAETRLWLIHRIKAYRGIVVVVSHDRAFLNDVATTVLEIDAANQRVALFHGNYDVYKTEKAAWRERQQEAHDLQQRQKREMEQWLVLKRQEASVHPSPAKGRLIRHMEHRLEREILDQEVHRPRASKDIMGAHFKGSIHASKLMARFSDVGMVYEERAIVNHLSWEIRGPARIRICGENGSGKTTLLRLLVGEIAPNTGTVELGGGIGVGYFSQQLESLCESDTVFEAFTKTIPQQLSEARIRAVLGAFLFTGDTIFKYIRQLSYGERVRLQLAMLLQQEYQLLVLDELTNHLDIPSREAIERALQTYEGAIVVVSHDEYFVQAIGVNQTYTLQEGALVQK